jgi:hypothetical protein
VEAVEVARRSIDTPHRIVDSLAVFEGIEHHRHRALELHEEAIALAHAAGDLRAARSYQHNRACELRLMGRVGEARDEMITLMPAMIRDMIPSELITLAEDYGAVLAELGHHRDAVQLLGAADVLRERHGYPRDSWQEIEIHDALAGSEKGLSRQDWDDSYQAGRTSDIRALLEAHVTA